MYETEINDELQSSIITIFGSEKHLQNGTNELINVTTICIPTASYTLGTLTSSTSRPHA